MDEVKLLRYRIRHVEKIQEIANDPDDKILSEMMLDSLCKKLAEEHSPKPKEPL